MEHYRSEPFVLDAMIESWPARKWTLLGLVEKLANQKLKIRLGKRRHENVGEVVWETNCPRVQGTCGQFLAWAQGARDEQVVGELAAFDYQTYWAYIDYAYMFEYFSPEHYKDVDWTVLNLPHDGRESTFWIGTADAYTACHYDTYGFNVVAQLLGIKRWVLFPPSDTPLMMASHLPYEESSIFSRLDLFHPPDQLRWASPKVVELKAGQVLFVPPRWWHFVQCLDTAISVNNWIPVRDDSVARVDEALARILAGLFRHHLPSTMVIDNHIDDLQTSLSLLNRCVDGTLPDDDLSDDLLARFLRCFAVRGRSIPTISHDQLCAVLVKCDCTSPYTVKPTISLDSVLLAAMNPAVIGKVKEILLRETN